MLRSMAKAKKDTDQFLLRPPRSVINRLEELTKRFERDSSNQVAVEILRDYCDLWAAAEQVKRDTMLQQRESVIRAIKQEVLRRPIHTAQTETDDKTQAQGKKGRK